jgi:hypothetical protein
VNDSEHDLAVVAAGVDVVGLLHGTSAVQMVIECFVSTCSEVMETQGRDSDGRGK